MNIGLVIKKRRLELNMTQLELSKSLGYESMQFVSLFERGLSKVPINTLGKIFVVLKFTRTQELNIINDLLKSYEKDLMLNLVKGKAELNE